MQLGEKMNTTVFRKLCPAALAFCAVSGLFAGAMAQSCLDFSTYLHWINEVDTPGSALAVEKRGNHLFVADGPGGLQVFNAIDPGNPTLAYTLNAAAGARDLTLSGNHAFVAAGNSGLHIVNILDPLSPFIEGTAATEGPASGVFIKDDLALVAVENFGLQIFDVAEPGLPTLINSIETPGGAYGVTANIYFAFVADGVAGIQIIDIIEPATGKIQGTINTPGNARNVVSRFRNLFVADRNLGLSVLTRTPAYFSEALWKFSNNGLDTSYRDFSDPNQTPRHHATLVGNAHFVEFEDNDQSNWGLFTDDSSSHAEYAPPIDRIYVGRFEFRFKLDASFAADPSFTDPIDIISSGSPGSNAGDFRVSLDPVDGTMVFSQENHETGVSLDLRTNLDTWVQDAWYDVEIIWDDLGREIRVNWSDDQGDYFDAQGDGILSPCFSIDAVDNLIGSRSVNSPPVGLTIDLLEVDDSEPSGSVETTIPLGGYALDLDFREDHAFVAVDYGDLHVVDFSPSGNWDVVGTVDTPDHSQSLAVTSDHVYVVDKDAGVQVISSPISTSPPLDSVLDTPGSAYGVAVSGNLAYVADRDFGLQIVDLASLTLPQLSGRVATAGYAMDVAVSGAYAYVAEAVFSQYADKLLNPTLASTVFPKDFFCVPGEKVSRFSGLQIIDVSDPAAPTVTGTVETPGFALDVEVVGNYSYVADFDAFVVIDSSVPDAPVIVATLETPGRPRDLTIRGNYAYVADLEGLQIIDISTPAAPQLTGSFNIPGSAYGVAVFGSLACVADVVSGLHVIDVADPASPQLLGTVFTPGGAYDVEVIGNFAYVANGFDTDFSSLQIVDVSVPGKPVLAGSLDTPRSVYGIALEGDHVFVTDGGNGLQIIQRQCDPGFPLTADLSIDGNDIVFASDQGPVEVTEGLELVIGIPVMNEGDRWASGRVVLEYEDDSGVRHPIADEVVDVLRTGTSGFRA